MNNDGETSGKRNERVSNIRFTVFSNDKRKQFFATHMYYK